MLQPLLQMAGTVGGTAVGGPTGGMIGSTLGQMGGSLLGGGQKQPGQMAPAPMRSMAPPMPPLQMGSLAGGMGHGLPPQLMQMLMGIMGGGGMGGMM